MESDTFVADLSAALLGKSAGTVRVSSAAAWCKAASLADRWPAIVWKLDLAMSADGPVFVFDPLDVRPEGWAWTEAR